MRDALSKHDVWMSKTLQVMNTVIPKAFSILCKRHWQLYLSWIVTCLVSRLAMVFALSAASRVKAPKTASPAVSYGWIGF